MFNKKAYFVFAIGTDIGKTHVIQQIIKEITSKNIVINAIKPIASGFLFEDKNSDSAKILESLGFEVSRENIENITPYHFAEAVSPNIAAKKNNSKIVFNDLVIFCQSKINQSEISNQILLIEGAGGVMTPINEDKNFLDLAKALKIPIILITSNYLGSISHTLTALKAIDFYDIKVAGVILNNSPMIDCNSGIKDLEFIDIISNFSNQKVFANYSSFLKDFLDIKF